MEKILSMSLLAPAQQKSASTARTLLPTGCPQSVLEAQIDCK